MIQSILIEQILTPLTIVVIGLVLGVALGIPARKDGSTGKLIAVGWATISGAAIWIFGLLKYSFLTSTPLFTNLSRLVSNSQYASSLFGGVQNAAVAFLIGLYEVGLILGIAAVSDSRRRSIIPEQIQQTPEAPLSNQLGFETRVRNADYPAVDLDFSKTKNANTTNIQTSSQSIAPLHFTSLDKDERSIVELFLFGNVQRIVPRIDASKPHGYYFEGVESVRLDTRQLGQLLDSLVRKKVLVAERADRLAACKECGSPHLILESICPNCESMQLSKHDMLEHFSCGLIGKQESFRTTSGDLVCPKCQRKLHLVDSDYRNIPPMYVCSECEALNMDLLQTTKCEDCGATSKAGEKYEQYLYSYSLNENARERLADQINPIEACSTYFKSLGYDIVAPAFVTGKSGTNYVFDILISDSSREASYQEGLVYRRNRFQNVVVEILVSSNPVGLEKVTRVYGKLRDLDCSSMIFAIPSLTTEARQYASQFKINVVEGRSIQYALQNLNASSFVSRIA